jgi:hypothetical protein
MVIWTAHAEDRQKEWEHRKLVTRELVERVLLNPEQVVEGDMGTFVAQSQWQGGLLRVPFVDTPKGRKALTVYWTSRIGRYWRASP